MFKTITIKEYFSLIMPLGRFSLLVVLSVCLFVPLVRTRNYVDWRLLVKERIPKSAILRNPFLGRFGQIIWVKNYFFGFLVNTLVPYEKIYCLVEPAYCA